MKTREEQIDAFIKAHDENLCNERYFTDDPCMMINAAIQEAEQRGRELERAEMADVPSRVARDVAELPDRTSPDGNPEMMLVTAQELIGIVRHALGCVGDGHDSDCATHNEPAFPNGPCNCTKRDTERLDWVERKHPEIMVVGDGWGNPDHWSVIWADVKNRQAVDSTGNNIRCAIDTAMNAETNQ